MTTSTAWYNTRVGSVFGFYPLSKENPKSDFIRNVAIVADWFPLAGIISGLARIIITLTIAFAVAVGGIWDAQFRNWVLVELGRGAVAIAGMGLIFLAIPDILATIGRRKGSQGGALPAAV